MWPSDWDEAGWAGPWRWGLGRQGCGRAWPGRRGLCAAGGVAWAWPREGTHSPGGAGRPVPGLLLLIALTGYTVKNAWKNNVFFSWSYFSGWLALPFSILAGNQGRRKRVDPVQGTPLPPDHLQAPVPRPHTPTPFPLPTPKSQHPSVPPRLPGPRSQPRGVPGRPAPTSLHLPSPCPPAPALLCPSPTPWTQVPVPGARPASLPAPTLLTRPPSPPRQASASCWQT